MKDYMFLCDLFSLSVISVNPINCRKYVLLINFVSKLASLTTAVSKLNNAFSELLCAWANRLSFDLNLSTILNKIPGTKHPHESNGLKSTLIRQLFKITMNNVRW